MSEQIKIGGVICDFMGLAEFRQRAQSFLQGEKLRHIVTLNPEMIMLAQERGVFRQAVAAADLRVPDGSGLVWARWYLRSEMWPLWPSLLAFLWQKVERVTGIEAISTLGQMAEQLNKKIYLLGGTEKQREKTAALLRKRWPALRVAQGRDDEIDLITKERPEILLVAYGAPKQTEWIEEHRGQLPSVRLAVGVGGAFAILSEERPRAPKWLRRANLEWLWRLYLEPTRMRRIWQATVRFPLLIRKQKQKGNNSAQ